MGGDATARLLHAKFDRVRSAELARMRKKVRRFSAAEQVIVESVTAAIVEALASRARAGLGPDPEPKLVESVVNLFEIAESSTDPSVR